MTIYSMRYSAATQKIWTKLTVLTLALITVVMLAMLAMETTAHASTAPAAPTKLTALGRSSSRIRLRWKDNSTNEDQFYIYYREGTSGSFNSLAGVAADSPNGDTEQYWVNGLSCDTPTYQFKVFAYNGSGWSASTNTVTVVLPCKPTGLSATAGANAVSLNWNDNSTKNQRTYVYYRPTNTGNYKSLGFVNGAASSATYSTDDSALSCGTEYQFRVIAYRRNNVPSTTWDPAWSAWSNTVKATPSCDQQPEETTCSVGMVCLYDDSNYEGTPITFDAYDEAYQTGYVYLDPNITGTADDVVWDFHYKLSSIINNSPYQIVLGYPGGTYTLAGNSEVDFSGQSLNDSVYYLSVSLTGCTEGDVAGKSYNALLDMLDASTQNCALLIAERIVNQMNQGTQFHNALNGFLNNHSNESEILLTNSSLIIDNYFVEGCTNVGGSSLGGLQAIITDSSHSSSLRLSAFSTWARIVSRKNAVTNNELSMVAQMLNQSDHYLAASAANALYQIAYFDVVNLTSALQPCEMSVSASQITTILSMLADAYTGETSPPAVGQTQLYIAYALNFIDYYDSNTWINNNSNVLASLPNVSTIFDTIRTQYENSYLEAPITCQYTTNEGGETITALIRKPKPAVSDSNQPSEITCAMLESVHEGYEALMPNLFNNPVPGDTDNVATLIIFGSNEQYRMYASVSGLPAGAGGVYIDDGNLLGMQRKAHLYTYDRPAEYALSLSHLVKHEFTHFVNGRYTFPESWSNYGREHALFDEGMAEYVGNHLGATGSPTPNENDQLSLCADSLPSLSTLLMLNETVYVDGGIAVPYDQFYSFAYYLINNDPAAFNAIYTSIRNQTYTYDNNYVAGYSISTLQNGWHNMVNNVWCQ